MKENLYINVYIDIRKFTFLQFPHELETEKVKKKYTNSRWPSQINRKPHESFMQNE